MKWLIASDLHGSAYYCKQLLAAYDREGADRMLLLGDLLYHGPRNDLPRDYDPKAVTAMLNGRQGDILAVRGNCDADIDQTVRKALNFVSVQSIDAVLDTALNRRINDMNPVLLNTLPEEVKGKGHKPGIRQ